MPQPDLLCRSFERQSLKNRRSAAELGVQKEVETTIEDIRACAAKNLAKISDLKEFMLCVSERSVGPMLVAQEIVWIGNTAFAFSGPTGANEMYEALCLYRRAQRIPFQAIP